jgi:hypothetical protein
MDFETRIALLAATIAGLGLGWFVERPIKLWMLGY